jgi:hypothetical protein
VVPSMFLLGLVVVVIALMSVVTWLLIFVA